MSARFHWRWMCAALLAAALVPLGVLRAQVAGSVADERGAPLAGVAVELWSVDRRAAAVASDAEGRFVLPAGAVATAGRIVLRRIGYAPLSARFSAEGPHAYRLRAEAVVLPGVAAAARGTCPRRDEPAAREIWRAAAARYAQDTPTHDFLVVRTEHHGWVQPLERGYPDEERMVSGSEGRVATEPIESFLPGHGYAFRREPGRMGYWGMEDYDRWNYVELDTRHAYHFATETFGRLNALAVVGRDAEGTTLAFCSREVRSSIHGTITVGTDGSFLSAGWRFRTPRPNEEAGGEVVFAPPGPGPRPHLLAARGLFWRTGTMRGRFWQRATINLEWTLGTAGHVPPPRGIRR